MFRAFALEVAKLCRSPERHGMPEPMVRRGSRSDVFNMFRLMMAAVLCSLWNGAGARAEVLTCATFKTRLAQALAAQASGEPPRLSFAATGGGGAIRRYDWRGVPNLSGKLTCGPGDAFADFFMAYDPDARSGAAVPADLARFDALAAGSVCALSDGTREACHAMATTMTGDGIDQYKEDLAGGDLRPQSLQDYDFAEDLDAVFYVTPTTLSWAIGPGVYKTVEAARPPLAPKDRDDDKN